MLFGLLWLVLWTAAAFAALAGFNLLLARLIERLVPPIGKFVDVDGLRLHYLEPARNRDRSSRRCCSSTAGSAR